jgi:MFS family permease
MVWAGTVGALVGPALIAPAASTAQSLGLPGLSGPVLVGALITTVALLASSRLPRTLAGKPRPRLSLAQIRSAVRRPAVLTPMVVMMAAQLAMVAMMSMTALQLHSHGHGLDVVGWILSAHMMGMFALAPVSGRIADRWGARVAIFGGIGTIVVAATTAIAAPTSHTSGLPVALFLLGYGWNLMFVGASSMLSRDLPEGERSQLQGVVDALVWGASTLATLVAGQLYGFGGYVLVAAVAGALALVPLWLMSAVRNREVTPAGPVI